MTAIAREMLDWPAAALPRPALEVCRPAQAGISVRAMPSVAGVSRAEWDALFPGAVEGWDYFRACELAAPQGFKPSAIGAFAGDALIAAAPLFRLDYRLDMPLQGPLRPAGDWLNRMMPRLLGMPVLGIGSPLTEECPIGFRPGLPAAERAQVLAALLAGLSQHAAATGVNVLALKDVTDRDRLWAGETLAAAGFAGVPTLPVATLHLPFKSEQEYLASLSSNMRGDLKKKMRSLRNVEVEVRSSIDDVAGEIVALFEATRARRKTDYEAFDEVPAGYFREVIWGLEGRAEVMLCRVDGQLASFNIFLSEKDRILGKYIGMRYPLAREHNIYFINWMMMVRLCLERGVPWLQTGQTSYCQKARLGCKLKRSWVYFKHRGALMGPLFRAVGSRLAFDRMDPDLAQLGAEAPYLPAGA